MRQIQGTSWAYYESAPKNRRDQMESGLLDKEFFFFLISSSELYSLQIKRIHYAIGSSDEYNAHTHTHTPLDMW